MTTPQGRCVGSWHCARALLARNLLRSTSADTHSSACNKRMLSVMLTCVISERCRQASAALISSYITLKIHPFLKSLNLN